MISPGRKMIAVRDSYRIRLIPLKLSEEKQEYLRYIARFDPFYHREQAKKAVEDQNWFAARFHFRCLIRHHPRVMSEYLELGLDELLPMPKALPQGKREP